MSAPEGILCSKDHQWIYFEQDETVTIGLTDIMIERFGDVIFIELPETNSVFYQDDVYSTIESTKCANELFIPISGEIIEVNEKLINSPELINDDPFSNWLIKVKPLNFKQDSLSLFDYDEYKDEVE